MLLHWKSLAKRREVALIAIAVFGICGSLWAANLARRPNRTALIATPSIIDCGKLSQGTVVSCEFRLYNPSPKPAFIRAVQASCNCAVTRAVQPAIAAYGETSIKVAWEVSARSGNSRAMITVVYDRGQDTPLKTAKVNLLAHVVPDYEYSPKNVTFMTGQGSTASATFRPVGNEQFEIRSAATTHEAFEAKVDGKNRVRVTFLPTKWSGGKDGAFLLIRTNSAKEPTCRIELFVCADNSSQIVP